MSDALARIFEAAAEARSASVRESADRPSQRRCAEEPAASPLVRAQASGVQVRAASEGDGAHFSGFASVYNRGYEMWDMFGPYTEQVSTGAGAESLARDDLDVPLVLAHDGLRRIARTTNGTLALSETDDGLLVDAPRLDRTDGDVAYILPKLESGLVDEMSFRFRIEAGSWSPDWSTYAIEKYDIHRGDVAIVGYGANPHTQGAGMRSQALPALTDLTGPQLRDLENALHAERRNRGSAPSMSRHALDLLAATLG